MRRDVVSSIKISTFHEHSHDLSYSSRCCGRRKVKPGMVKVVPTEGSPANGRNGGTDGKKEHVTSNDSLSNTDVQHPPNDDDYEAAYTETNSANNTSNVDGTCARDEDQSPGVYTAIDPDAPRLDPSKSSDGDEAQEDLPTTSHKEASGRDCGAADNSLQLPTSKLDMEKHSGMTTFSLMRQGNDSGPDQTSTPDGEVEETNDETGILADRIDEAEDDDDQLKLAGAAFARRGTQRFVRQDTGIGIGDGVSSGDGKKKRTFRVPQTMYMGHPLGSPAAEFLERQQHRLAEVKSRREVVAGRVGFVMEHNPGATGSGLPDIDEVFPDNKGAGDNNHGDWCV